MIPTYDWLPHLTKEGGSNKFGGSAAQGALGWVTGWPVGRLAGCGTRLT